jgi:hypothetical protein
MYHVGRFSKNCLFYLGQIPERLHLLRMAVSGLGKALSSLAFKRSNSFFRMNNSGLREPSKLKKGNSLEKINIFFKEYVCKLYRAAWRRGVKSLSGTRCKVFWWDKLLCCWIKLACFECLNQDKSGNPVLKYLPQITHKCVINQHYLRTTITTATITHVDNNNNNSYGQLHACARLAGIQFWLSREMKEVELAIPTIGRFVDRDWDVLGLIWTDFFE